MNFDELKSRNVKELRKLAGQYGIRVGGRAKAETIAKLIVEFVQNKPKIDMQHPAEKPQPAPLVINTEEEVRSAIVRYLEKPGFTAEFPGDNTVILRCKGAEESIHLSTIMRVIVSKAQSVARGAVNPRGLKDNPLNPSPNSGVILMV